jgi:hypothetical protein
MAASCVCWGNWRSLSFVAMSAQCFLHRLLHLKQEVAESVVYGAIEFGKGNGRLIRSRCFQSLNGGKYAVQSVDF